MKIKCWALTIVVSAVVALWLIGISRLLVIKPVNCNSQKDRWHLVLELYALQINSLQTNFTVTVEERK